MGGGKGGNGGACVDIRGKCNSRGGGGGRFALSSARRPRPRIASPTTPRGAGVAKATAVPSRGNHRSRRGTSPSRLPSPSTPSPTQPSREDAGDDRAVRLERHRAQPPRPPAVPVNDNGRRATTWTASRPQPHRQDQSICFSKNYDLVTSSRLSHSRGLVVPLLQSHLLRLSSIAAVHYAPYRSPIAIWPSSITDNTTDSAGPLLVRERPPTFSLSRTSLPAPFRAS